MISQSVIPSQTFVWSSGGRLINTATILILKIKKHKKRTMGSSDSLAFNHDLKNTANWIVWLVNNGFRLPREACRRVYQQIEPFSWAD